MLGARKVDSNGPEHLYKALGKLQPALCDLFETKEHKVLLYFQVMNEIFCSKQRASKGSETLHWV